MAITPTSLSNAINTTTQTSYTATLSREAVDTTTVYAAYYSRHATDLSEPTTPAVTGGMPTWTLVADVWFDTDTQTRKLFVFEGTGTPSGTTVTFDHGGVSHLAAGWVIAEFDSDTAGVAIVTGQVAESPDGNTGYTTLEVTLPAAPTGGVVMITAHASVGTTTPEAGYTVVGNVSGGTPFSGEMDTFWDAAGADQTPSASWPGPNQGAVIAFELEESAGGEPPQFARPDADLHVGNWTDEGGATIDLYQSIDEATASDADFVRSENTPSSSVYVCSLGAVTDPGVHTDHTLRYRYDKEDVSGTPTINLTVELRQGYVSEGTPGTVIASATHNGVTDALTDGTLALTTGEAGNITDYSDLAVRFVATQA